MVGEVATGTNALWCLARALTFALAFANRYWVVEPKKDKVGLEKFLGQSSIVEVFVAFIRNRYGNWIAFEKLKKPPKKSCHF